MEGYGGFIMSAFDWPIDCDKCDDPVFSSSSSWYYLVADLIWRHQIWSDGKNQRWAEALIIAAGNDCREKRQLHWYTFPTCIQFDTEHFELEFREPSEARSPIPASGLITDSPLLFLLNWQLDEELSVPLSHSFPSSSSSSCSYISWE